MPFFAEEISENEHVNICLANLQTALKSSRETIETSPSVPVDDFKKFFKIINSKKISLSEEASQLIQNYFVASRRERPQCLPLNAIKTM